MSTYMLRIECDHGDAAAIVIEGTQRLVEELEIAGGRFAVQLETVDELAHVWRNEEDDTVDLTERLAPYIDFEIDAFVGMVC